MRIVQGPGQAQGAEALRSARGARREARLSASARLGQPWRQGPWPISQNYLVLCLL